MKKFDFIIILVILLGLSSILFINLTKNPSEDSKLVIYLNNSIYKQIDLSPDLSMEIPIESSYGYNLVKIENGVVSMLDSDCPDKLCVKSMEIDKSLETIVCLPHKLVLKIEGDNESTIDSLSR